jgi:hypothetical protein
MPGAARPCDRPKGLRPQRSPPEQVGVQGPPHQSRASVALRTITPRRSRCRRSKVCRVMRSPRGPQSIPSSSVTQISRADDPDLAGSSRCSRRSRSRRIAFCFDRAKPLIEIAGIERLHVGIHQFRQFARFARGEVAIGYSGSNRRHCCSRIGWRLQFGQVAIAPAARAVAVGCARDINALPRYRRRAPFRGPCGSAPRPRRQAKFQPRRWLCGARLPADLRNCRIRLSERVALAVFPLLFQPLWVKLYHEKVAGLRQVWVPVSLAFG